MDSSAAHSDRILLVDKPYTWTSFDVVNKLRYQLGVRKIGHAGTLDPLATGLLIICTGKMTKEIERFMGLEKEYTGAFVLGQSTPSHDKETEVDQTWAIDHLSLEQIQKTTELFQGVVQQVPPQHSAIRIGGKRAYALARKGKDPELKPREVVIHELQLTDIQLPVIRFRMVCSKGTYIRSFVRDFGKTLGVGAFLSELCRTRIGPYLLREAIKIEDIA